MSHAFKRMQQPIMAALLVLVAACASTPPPGPRAADRQDVLELLGISPSEESIDYVRNKTQFQLHTLLTEQRHPRTWNLSERISRDTAEGLRMLFSVDDDIAARLDTLSREPETAALSGAFERAMLQRRKIYIYGTGATGRLAKEMESTFWRPFWRRVLADSAIRAKLAPHLSAGIESDLIGEMTGADRALISSLEGFEDLQLIGRLQLADHGIRKGDVVVEVTEGGETSAGIGTVLGALDQWKFDGGEGGKPLAGYDPAEAAGHLFFVYNNPDAVLLPFERSRQVIEQPGITKLNLATGPQAITGSTRMQATTIETFVIAHALQDAIQRLLGRWLDSGELARLGFEGGMSLEARLARFPDVLSAVKAAVPDLARLTDLESDTYRDGHFSTYFADRGLITVFIDSTERSPTFRLFPLDTVNETGRRSWIQVWTPAGDPQEAWRKMLGRPFRGLQPARYREPFATGIDDPYLRNAALESLKRAGDDQQALYDFSFSGAALERSGPQRGDLGVMVAVGDESRAVADRDSAFGRFGAVFEAHGARLGIVHVGTEPAPAWPGAGAIVHVPVGTRGDPLGVDQQIALKMLLNAHSTAVMAKLDKVVGNTMTNVSPSNLKLIGRATYLIQSHVNDVLGSEAWTRRHGRQAPITYAQANAVLFDTIGFVREKKRAGDQAAAEVSLAIVRILESLRLRRAVSYDEALGLLKSGGLNGYLAGLRGQ